MFSDIMYTHDLSCAAYVGSISSNFKIIAMEPRSGYRFFGLDGFKFNHAYCTCLKELQNIEQDDSLILSFF